ncbi:cell division protein FtsQ/DivIB [Paucihalobacter sp.]|uniref:cell division protein FtsQ/DivIB n=1 Tax=Paucihalobacter sp. TaxID=2850405 RepID=UPI002FDFB21D
MRVKLRHIKLPFLVLAVTSLFAFTNSKNSKREIKAVDIVFKGDQKLFLTTENVSKLLIQNQEAVMNKPKEIIDLNLLESALKTNQIIKNAEVHLSVDGVLTAEIEQKRPIARVNTNASYYIDDQGTFMPLSSNYSARVPLITGAINKKNAAQILPIAKKIDEDAFLKSHVIEMILNDDDTVDLRFRTYDFKIHLGTLKQLDKKINNLKAFYQKAYRDSTLQKYSLVNLKFDNQVICTKK